MRLRNITDLNRPLNSPVPMLHVFSDTAKMLSSLDKPYWPEESITKRDLVDYYQSISKLLMPCLKDRAQSFFRYPYGITKPGFVQKDIPHTPDWVHTVTVLKLLCAFFFNNGLLPVFYILFQPLILLP